MKPLVVDASVAALAFFRERGFEPAQALFQTERPLHAPDLIFAEFANVVWKRHRRGEISDDDAEQLLADFLRLPLLVTPSRELATPALQLAMRTDRTVYDCLYLALAVKTGSVLVTADKRLANALAQGPLAKHVSTIGAYR